MNTSSAQKYLFQTIVFGWVVLISCGDYKRGIPSKAPAVDDSYQTMIMEETWNGCTSGDGECTYARAVFPQFISPDAEFLNSFILSTIARSELNPSTEILPPDSVLAALKKFVVQFDEFKKEFPEVEHTWFRDVSVVSNRPFVGWISLEFTQVEFQGGAHESKKTLIQNFDLQKKSAVTLSEIMKPGFEPELSAKLASAFRLNQKLAPTDSLKKAGLFDESWKLPSNYQLTATGIRFLYNPYEIAPWSVGTIEILLTWKELETISLIKPLI